jgi:hypothetical protein
MDQQELVGAVAAAANVEPRLAQEALAEEENDANAAVSLLLTRQEEAELVAVQEGKAGQGAAQPRNTVPAVLELWVVPPSLTLPGSGSGSSSSRSSSSSRARSTTTRRRMRCIARELSATRRWPNPRAISRVRVPEGALDGG